MLPSFGIQTAATQFSGRPENWVALFFEQMVFTRNGHKCRKSIQKPLNWIWTNDISMLI
jgi:hypothetical protein